MANKRSVSGGIDDTKTNLVAETEREQPRGNSFLASRGMKIFLGIMIFLVVFTLGYGLWRLSGGSFKPKTTCPDGTVETRLRDGANANPASFTAQLEYGDYLYSQCRKYDLSIEPYQKAVRLADQVAGPISKADQTKAHLSLGLAYFYTNQNLKEAQSQFRTVVSLEPQNPLGSYMLASTLRQEDPVQALSLFKKVVELDPNGALGKDAQKSVTELAH